MDSTRRLIKTCVLEAEFVSFFSERKRSPLPFPDSVMLLGGIGGSAFPDSCFRTQDSGLRTQDSGLRTQDSRFIVRETGFSESWFGSALLTHPIHPSPFLIRG